MLLSSRVQKSYMHLGMLSHEASIIAAKERAEIENEQVSHSEKNCRLPRWAFNHNASRLVDRFFGRQDACRPRSQDGCAPLAGSTAPAAD
jgi:hypothetical protein